jgi:hypothetical protein
MSYTTEILIKNITFQKKYLLRKSLASISIPLVEQLSRRQDIQHYNTQHKENRYNGIEHDTGS